ncbi:MAG: hypothetical protein K2P66_03515, partial [Lachnospiraceae bacterium]|nr:hypothetical protein [Lachnospiraceae bacterium]
MSISISASGKISEHTKPTIGKHLRKDLRNHLRKQIITAIYYKKRRNTMNRKKAVVSLGHEALGYTT